MQLYVGDWLNDEKLSLCLPSTRGIWIDILCRMHQKNRCGKLSGTVEEIARLARCSPVALNLAIDDLKAHKTATVRFCNGVVTFINRRMYREAKSRELTRLRVLKIRSNARVTPYARALQNQSQRSEASHTHPAFSERPNFEEVKTYADRIGLAEWRARDWFDEMEGVGWVDNKNRPVKRWQSIVDRVKVWWEADGRPKGPKTYGNHSQNSKENHRNHGIATDPAEQGKRITDALERKAEKPL